MNINRDNYEEFFLLYVDNELSAENKNRVEIFIAENPDLKKELQMLQQSIVTPESVSYADKQELLKTQPINAGIQEQLLLLLDNELPGKPAQQLRSLTEQNKTIQEEWQVLLQTKLSPADVILFQDKDLLYKKEERRVVPIRWWQLAAAAMLIGFGLWGTVSHINRNNPVTIVVPSTSSAKANTNPVVEINTTQAITAKESVQKKTEISSDNNSVAARAQKHLNKGIVQNKKINPENIIKQELTTIPVAAQNDLVQQQNVVIPTSDLQNLNTATGNNPTITNVSISTNTTASATNGNQPTDTYAVNTSGGISDENGFDEDEIDKPRKSKLGGFFKRVKRTLERKTKIKTGSSDEIKIANMSFAMH